jgi:hypothetical protein
VEESGGGLIRGFIREYFLKDSRMGQKISVNIVSFSSRYSNQKVKVKFSLEQAMKAQRGSTGIALLFL